MARYGGEPCKYTHELFGPSAWSGRQIEIRGYVACYGGDHRFIAYFLTDDSPVPDVEQPWHIEGAIGEEES